MQAITVNASSSTPQPAAAKPAVLLSYVTYDPDPVKDITTYLPGWEVVWSGIETYDGNYAFIAQQTGTNTYALAIRGSLPPQDIFKKWDAFANWVIQDMDVVVTASWPYANNPDAIIAQGTANAFSNIQGMQDALGSGLTITEYLGKYVVAPGHQLIITGHSLGGNIANVYASFFVSNFANTGYSVSNVSLFTFAAPAAGNAAYANDLDAKLPNAWHYHNFNDIVPCFPVSLMVGTVAYHYIPQPDAGAISFTLDGKTVTLREAFLILAGTFYLYGYQQQSNNYFIFNTQLDPDYTSNTVTDFFQQVGSQHHLQHYATFLGVTIPTATLLAAPVPA